ncbi:AAA family ATPase [Cyclobacterium sp. 1_MG-2023]|uniref:ATP-dependent nuclease n=1 Tax=Cyclobacterium sp. 1_MG-2023 TaxID=3062681 RepID=UPI0026E428FC|nr:AAA family ATPase [Cyclobacterium sp. 1_MG-2023]MDO6440217.1 AAA family ATPase [Cyclobacterium sp. 1_MG-2023]
MIIKSIHIKKFRGFNDVRFELGANLTVIAGQNGTQKTTLLGIISQPFTITDKENPLYGEKPLCGGNYKSLFSEKFKLSDAFDQPKGHEWTLSLNNVTEPEFTVESIERKDKSGSKGIRFWQKGDRSKGSGYIQLPVIYLSLSRLFPIGEDTSIDTSNEITLTEAEFKFYQDWHNKILIIPNVEMTSVDYLASKQKNTLGANTSFYDWKMNSAGQDNIGKVLLAILSFKRLKEIHGAAYQGGILAIDELDATLYPASQLKLIEALRKFSSQLNIQVVFTTHSLSILEKACEWQEDVKITGQLKVVYLQKVDSKVKAIDNISYEVIKNKLNVALSIRQKPKKIPVFTEDKEGEVFFRAIIKRKSTVLQFVDCTLGCDNLIELARKKIVGFRFPESLIVLDGDVKTEASKMRKINQNKNFLVLPGNKSPERLIAEFLYNLPDESEHWDNIYDGYSKQHVFRDYSLREIQTNRDKAKEWFNSQKPCWGRNCANVINLWMAENQEEVDAFIYDFEKLLEKYNKLLLN